MSAPTYRYGQIRWALWQLMRKPEAVAEAPKVFLARFTRLIDTDRKLMEKAGRDRLTFLNQPPVGKGAEAEYSLDSAFCLAFALYMMDLGFNQLDVFHYVHRYREQLVSGFHQISEGIATEGTFKALLKDFHAHTQKSVAARKKPKAHRPGSFVQDFNELDPRRYVIIKYAQVSEAHGRKPRDEEYGLMWEPDFLNTAMLKMKIADMYSPLDNPTFNRLSRFSVIEVGYMASRLQELLDRAPLKRRGR